MTKKKLFKLNIAELQEDIRSLRNYIGSFEKRIQTLEIDNITPLRKLPNIKNSIRRSKVINKLNAIK